MTHLHHTGHVVLPTGGVLRLDLELGQYVASEYWPDLSLRRYARGGLEAMASLLEGWEAAAICPRLPGQPAGEAPLERMDPPAGPTPNKEEAA